MNHGDEVIIPAPYRVSYPDRVRLVGGIPVEVSCPENQGFKITAAQLFGMRAAELIIEIHVRSKR